MRASHHKAPLGDAAHLPVWVIYENPSDYPGSFVVRRQQVRDGQIVPDKECAVVASLEAARARIPTNLVRLPPDPLDDPVIAEVWI